MTRPVVNIESAARWRTDTPAYLTVTAQASIPPSPTGVSTVDHYTIVAVNDVTAIHPDVTATISLGRHLTRDDVEAVATILASSPWLPGMFHEHTTTGSVYALVRWGDRSTFEQAATTARAAIGRPYEAAWTRYRVHADGTIRYKPWCGTQDDLLFFTSTSGLFPAAVWPVGHPEDVAVINPTSYISDLAATLGEYPPVDPRYLAPAVVRAGYTNISALADVLNRDRSTIYGYLSAAGITLDAIRGQG